MSCSMALLGPVVYLLFAIHCRNNSDIRKHFLIQAFAEPFVEWDDMLSHFSRHSLASTVEIWIVCVHNQWQRSKRLE